jgi:hypothetical protein
LLTMPVQLTIIFSQNEKVKVTMFAGFTPPKRASHVNARFPKSSCLCGTQSSPQLFNCLFALRSPIR